MTNYCIQRAIGTGLLALGVAIYTQVSVAQVQSTATVAQQSQTTVPGDQQRFQNYQGYYHTRPPANYRRYGYLAPNGWRQPGYRYGQYPYYYAPGNRYSPYRSYVYPDASLPYWYFSPYGPYPYWYAF